MLVVGEVGSAMFPPPSILYHNPVAAAIISLPTTVVLFCGKHNSWSSPAFAGPISLLNTLNVIISVLNGLSHDPFSIVHMNSLTPSPRFVITVFGS